MEKKEIIEFVAETVFDELSRVDNEFDMEFKENVKERMIREHSLNGDSVFKALYGVDDLETYFNNFVSLKDFVAPHEFEYFCQVSAAIIKSFDKITERYSPEDFGLSEKDLLDARKANKILENLISKKYEDLKVDDFENVVKEVREIYCAA